MITIDKIVDEFEVDTASAKIIFDLLSGETDPDDLGLSNVYARFNQESLSEEYKTLIIINELINGFGIEKVSDSEIAESEYSLKDIRLSFINTGDVESPTVIWDYEEESWHVESFNEFCEDHCQPGQLF